MCESQTYNQRPLLANLTFSSGVQACMKRSQPMPVRLQTAVAMQRYRPLCSNIAQPHPFHSNLRIERNVCTGVMLASNRIICIPHMLNHSVVKIAAECTELRGEVPIVSSRLTGHHRFKLQLRFRCIMTVPPPSNSTDCVSYARANETHVKAFVRPEQVLS